MALNKKLETGTIIRTWNYEQGSTTYRKCKRWKQINQSHSNQNSRRKKARMGYCRRVKQRGDVNEYSYSRYRL